MASSICWKFHFGVYSAYLLCNHNNSCCLCLAFTLKFIYKHLPAGSLIYFGKWHHQSVGKFTVVYNVNIHYALTILSGACVLLLL